MAPVDMEERLTDPEGQSSMAMAAKREKLWEKQTPAPPEAASGKEGSASSQSTPKATGEEKTSAAPSTSSSELQEFPLLHLGLRTARRRRGKGVVETLPKKDSASAGAEQPKAPSLVSP